MGGGQHTQKNPLETRWKNSSALSEDTCETYSRTSQKVLGSGGGAWRGSETVLQLGAVSHQDLN